ncbi:YggN family protein [Stenotrophomonas maltophilia]|uniref:YggN family protein n=1 Tax=Stenotrophomonas maltophilia TaxID=40324 RepID=UPI001FA728F0|nr:YggN family protein [Stenotrophomonas maltophilia]
MNLLRLLPATLLCLPLIACGGTSSAPDKSVGKSVAEATSGVGQTVKEAMDDARKDIAQGNIKISADKQPRAGITPDGRLLIAGKEVAANDVQRRHLQEYRGHVVAVAMAGMDVGLAGAKLGANAAGEALKGIFSGDSEGVEKRINAEAAKIEAQAKRICDRLPAMLASQQALARELPAFKPYATMDQSDVDDCGKDNSVTFSN